VTPLVSLMKQFWLKILAEALAASFIAAIFVFFVADIFWELAVFCFAFIISLQSGWIFIRERALGKLIAIFVLLLAFIYLFSVLIAMLIYRIFLYEL
jgi:hypothetical protein